ncbi:amidase [Bradyrhizobium sp. LHD-71]|uniref:amidase n=1 Tax=Bradyrhizobium sp. LHD-71 TaxID=3072141 RepID=UPI00280FD800|nr:amidase [Bradyrhizobium sp. LHD-71]MDQ8728245.1 amidase [Bradyrhizobium sp. LHD-71]
MADATLPLKTATELVSGLRSGRLSAQAVLDAHLDRIEKLDPDLSAFITIDADAAHREAERLDAIPADARGLLHGLPIGVKDLVDTASLRTTYGSLLYAEHVPQTDDLVVARLKAAGAIIVGKTNTPEFGFGAVCQNRLCGPTRNLFDRTLTSGGSSGGSAVAVASGMVPLAHGTDFGGSVRTPASFCGAVAIRPTPGRIPSPGRKLAWDTLATHGAMARTVDDCALMLTAMTGSHPDDPTSTVSDAPQAVGRLRIAATHDFGIAPVSADVRERFQEALEFLGSCGEKAVVASPDCSGAIAAFKTLRAAHVCHSYRAAVNTSDHRLTPTAAWNVAQGDRISAQDYLNAEEIRGRLYRNFRAFFADHDLLIAPAASVLPWPNEMSDILSIDGTELPTIIDYLAITFIVSLVGFPVLSIPAPQGSHRLPFGLQVVARPGAEATLVAFGCALEAEGFRHQFARE